MSTKSWWQQLGQSEYDKNVSPTYGASSVIKNSPYTYTGENINYNVAPQGLASASYSSTPSLTNAMAYNTVPNMESGGLLFTEGTSGLPSYTDSAGGFSINSAGTSNVDMSANNYLGNVGSGDSSSFSGSEMLGLANLGLKGMGAFTDWQQLGLAKDTLKFNMMNANRAYDADKLKYNNSLARTEAVNAVYGSPNVAEKLK